MNTAYTTVSACHPISRGDVWKVNLDPVVGHEQGGQRPAVIVSVDRLNRGPAGTVIVVPMTTKDKGIAWHLRVTPSDANVPRTSYLKCEDVRAISTDRLIERWGIVSVSMMDRLTEHIRFLIGA